MTTFDPAKYKEATREQWQAAAKAWNDWGPLLRVWLGPATELMLDMAKIGPGSRVLDVAAGAGDQSLQTAARVGPNGYVLATDISSKVLEFAARNARAAGYANVETKVLDAENLDVPEASFDAVISRVGLIYFPDQQKALAGMRRALKPGGRVATIVYSTAESNQFFSIPVAIIRRRAALAAPLAGQPGPFSLGARQACSKISLPRPSFEPSRRVASLRRSGLPLRLNAYGSRGNHSAHYIKCLPASMKLPAALLGRRSSRSSAISRDRRASRAPAR